MTNRRRFGSTGLPAAVAIAIAAFVTGCGDDSTAPNPGSFSGLVAWFDASALTGFAEDDPVGTWPDRSANGNDATQATASDQPLYKASLIGGKPGLSFDGTDFLATGSVSLGTLTVFVVFNATADGMPVTHGDAVGTGDGHWIYTSTGCSLDLRRGGTFSGKDVDIGWGSDGASRIVAHVFDGTHAGHLLYVNGAAETLVECLSDLDPGTTPTSQALGIGARPTGQTRMTGSIAEVIVYDRVLPDEERETVEAYLNAKYAVF